VSTVSQNDSAVILYHSRLHPDQRLHDVESPSRQIAAVSVAAEIVNGEMSLAIIEHAKAAIHTRGIEILLETIVFRYITLGAARHEKSQHHPCEKSPYHEKICTILLI
jgi:hypothetical protein